MSDPRISSIIPVSQQGVKEIQKEIAAERVMQVESEESLSQYFELATFSPMNQVQRFRNLKEISSKTDQKVTETDETEELSEQVVDIEKIDEASERYQRGNYELSAETLKILRSQVSKGDTPADVLKAVQAIYADAALADEALDFLAETSDAELLAATQEAKEKFNKDKGKEIRAGRNMGAQAREFAKEGLGSPTGLRDLYRDIILNPREPLKLFDELAEKFQYPTLKSAITFMLHSLGSDMKAKGPSIQRGELKRLLDETRSMQGILGVFRFFQSRMRLIQREFASYKLVIPSRLNFEIIARIFVKILAERFMNPDKIFQTAKLLGISEELAAQMIIYSQMRDAIKQIAPKYFRDPRHRDEILKAFIDTIDKIEDEMEKEDEEEEK
ncbi:MAG: HrpJ domain-containing protein [Chlamydiales bacterium]